MANIVAALNDYWGTYTDPVTSEFPVFPIQQIKGNTWYTFGYHIKPSAAPVGFDGQIALIENVPEVPIP